MIVQHTPHRILVIEHDVWIRADLVARLQDGGFQVREASNGFTGLRLARGVIPDVIVLGGALPDIGPSQVREELEADPSTRSVPLIALGSDCRSAARLVAAEVRLALEAKEILRDRAARECTATLLRVRLPGPRRPLRVSPADQRMTHIAPLTPVG